MNRLLCLTIAGVVLAAAMLAPVSAAETKTECSARAVYLGNLDRVSSEIVEVSNRLEVTAQEMESEMPAARRSVFQAVYHRASGYLQSGRSELVRTHETLSRQDPYACADHISPGTHVFQKHQAWNFNDPSGNGAAGMASDHTRLDSLVYELQITGERLGIARHFDRAIDDFRAADHPISEMLTQYHAYKQSL